MVALRPFLHEFIAYAVTNALIIYPLVLFVYSIRALSKKPIGNTGLYEFIVFLYGFVVYAFSWFDLAEYRTLFAAGCWVIGNLWVYWQLQRLGEIFDSKFARLFKYLYIASALAWFLRLVLIAREGLNTLSEPSTMNWVSFVLIYILLFSSQFLYLIIRLTDERSQRHQIEELNEFLKLEIFEKLQIKQKADGLEKSLLSVLNSLAMARDNETGNHIVRTQNYVKQLAQRLNALGKLENHSPEFIDNIHRAAPLHDIGKIGIPDAILHKPGRLDEHEWDIMKTHASIGENVLSAASREHEIDSQLIKLATEIAGGHHENWDGSGYPRGLTRKTIPLSARIMAVADTYDALISERVYKNEWTHEQAVQEIIAKRGNRFDPDVVDAFLMEAAQFQVIAQKYKDE